MIVWGVSSGSSCFLVNMGALGERRFGPDPVFGIRGIWDNGSRPWDMIRLISGWRCIVLR
jgi:hypothetical protein